MHKIVWLSEGGLGAARKKSHGPYQMKNQHKENSISLSHGPGTFLTKGMEIIGDRRRQKIDV